MKFKKHPTINFCLIDEPEGGRPDEGLQSVFKSVFPIADFSNTSLLEFVKYEFEPPKYDVDECRQRGMTYAAPLKVTLRLIVFDVDPDTAAKSVKDIKEQDVYMGDMPLMTMNGTFIVNGTERVIVSQMHRSPGVFFDHDKGKSHSSGKLLFAARIIPYRGSWLDIEFDAKDIVYARIDRRRKIPATSVLYALGMDGEEILSTFYKTVPLTRDKDGWRQPFDPERLKGMKAVVDMLDAETGEVVLEAGKKLTVRTARQLAERGLKFLRVQDEDLYGQYIAADLYDPATGEIFAEAGDEISAKTLPLLIEAGFNELPLLDIDHVNIGPYIRNTLAVDKNSSREEALFDIYRVMRPGEPPTPESAEAMFRSLFFDPERYDLSAVGRVKMNMRMDLDAADTVRTLRKEDIVAVMRALVDLRDGRGEIDDIDHLGNRRVRSVGELMENQYRLGLLQDGARHQGAHVLGRYRYGDAAGSHQREAGGRFRARIFRLVAAVAVHGSDQSAVRDHPQAASLGAWAGRPHARAGRLRGARRASDPLWPHLPDRDAGRSEYRPHQLARHFRARQQIRLHRSALPPHPRKSRDGGGRLSFGDGGRQISRRAGQCAARRAGAPDRGSGRLPPFRRRRHGSARARRLHGRFAETARLGRGGADPVPRERRRQPRADGLQHAAPGGAARSRRRASRRNRHGGRGRARFRRGHRRAADRARSIRSTPPASSSGRPRNPTPSKPGVDIYRLMKFQRSNQSTCVNQKPLVRVGDFVRKGDIIADGPSTDLGDLALGRNVLVAFMPWNGYNFEDSILLNERIVKDDVFTSIHIDEFEVMARDTKLGPEEITRDIPNVSEEALKNLDEAGIVYIGAEVQAGDILVGKITPKGESPMTPEEKLLRAIFGEKASDVRDTSLRVPPGVTGTIVEVRVFNRHGVEKDERAQAIEREEIERLAKDRDDELAILDRNVYARLLDVLIGKKAIAGPKGFKKDTVLTRAVVDEYPRSQWWIFAVENDQTMAELEAMRKQYDESKKGLESRFLDKVEKLQRGDELSPGVMKMVKVFVAVKRKIQPGDKMAGRHGNKGVVSKIVPQEDMPFLADGTPVDIVLNPLGVPSRMNVGQILETHLGWACAGLGRQVAETVNSYLRDQNSKPLRAKLAEIYDAKKEIAALDDEAVVEIGENLRRGVPIATPVFDGAHEKDIVEMLEQAGLDPSGQVTLYDGRTGEAFDRKVTVGYIYMLKLHHLVDDKIHARSIGPYSLVTQQPLGGKAQFGGQRFGEMEVWALEAYGAAYTLQEMLTVKSDDVAGRTKVYELIVRGDDAFESGIPESFNVLVKEMRSLCLNVELTQTVKIAAPPRAEAAE